MHLPGCRVFDRRGTHLGQQPSPRLVPGPGVRRQPQAQLIHVLLCPESMGLEQPHRRAEDRAAEPCNADAVATACRDRPSCSFRSCAHVGRLDRHVCAKFNRGVQVVFYVQGARVQRLLCWE